MTPIAALLPCASTNPSVKEIAYYFEGNTAPPVKLYYFDIEYVKSSHPLVSFSSIHFSQLFSFLYRRGKCEDVRTALYYAQVNFIDVRLNRETFYSLKNSGNALAFGQLPALLTSDGEHLLVQTNAILRYITTLTDIGASMYPRNNPIDAAHIDALLDFQFDTFSGLTVSAYPSRMGYDFLEEQPELKAGIRRVLNESILPQHLTSLRRAFRNKLVEEGPWLTGRLSPSIADFAWFHRFQMLGNGTMDGIDKDIVTSTDEFRVLLDTFNALPSIQEYRAKRDAALAHK